MKYVVLTGVSGGMGLATAKRLSLEGYRIFGLDFVEPKEEIPNLKFIKTDLTRIKDVEHAFKMVARETYELHAIISMAGINKVNSLLEMKEEDFIEIFNINVFGIFRLNKAFAPLLKKKGKVIMISSELAPLDPLPFIGIYSITKSTVEKYAYSLRMELQLLDKQVVVVRPGAVGTSFIKKSNAYIEEFTNNTELYKVNAANFENVVTNVESKKIPPEKIANLINKILNKKKPKYVYKINRNFGLLCLSKLPKRMQNWIIKQILKKRKD